MSFLKLGPNRKQLKKALWRSNKPSTEAAPIELNETRPPLLRHSTDPAPRQTRRRLLRRPRLLPLDSLPNATMKGTATITFTQHGVQPPVYLVTSASHPPWELLEMDASDDKTASGDTVFVRRLLDVPEGSYQYKVRIGDSHWVIDEAKETGMPDCCAIRGGAS